MQKAIVAFFSPQVEKAISSALSVVPDHCLPYWMVGRRW